MCEGQKKRAENRAENRGVERERLTGGCCDKQLGVVGSGTEAQGTMMKGKEEEEKKLEMAMADLM